MVRPQVVWIVIGLCSCGRGCGCIYSLLELGGDRVFLVLAILVRRVDVAPRTLNLLFQFLKCTTVFYDEITVFDFYAKFRRVRSNFFSVGSDDVPDATVMRP